MINVSSITWDILKEKEIYYDVEKTKKVKIKSLMQYIREDEVKRDKKDILKDILTLCGLTVKQITAPNNTSIMFQTEASGKYGFLQIVLNTNASIECTTTPKFGMVYFKPFESSSSSDVREILINNNSTTMTGGNGVIYSLGYVSICMHKNSSYMFQDSLMNQYYVGNVNTNTKKHNKPIEISDIKQSSSNRWSDIVNPPNFGVLNQNIQGTNSLLAEESTEMFKYTYKYLDTTNPYMWNLNNDSMFVCYSNFDGSDNWGTANRFSSGGNAEQLYRISGRLFGGRDKVEKAPMDNWLGKASYSSIMSSETDYGKTHDYSTGTHYVWESKIQFTKQAKEIKTYEESKTILVLQYNKTTKQLNIKKNNDTYTYNLNNYKKILLAKRELISLQEIFDATKHTRFMMCYADSRGSAAPSSRFAHILALHSYSAPQNPYYLYYRPSVTNKVQHVGKEYHIGLADSAGYFEFETADDFSETTYHSSSIEQTINVNLPEIEYFDITSLLQEKQELAFPRDLNLLPTKSYTNIKRADIEHTWDSTEYVFNFDKKPNTINDKTLGYYWHGGVKYTIKINNIKTLGIPQIQGSIEHIQNIQTANLEHLIYNQPTSSTISSSVLVQDYFSWTNMPNWFTEHFINLGCDEFCIARSAVSDFSVYQYVKFAKNKNSVIQETDSNHQYFACVINVTGWADWKYDNLIPASTALQLGNTDYTKNPTWYAHCVKYWSPYDEDVPLGEDMTGRGLQLGLTTGIAINYPNLDSVDPATYRIENNEMPSIGILISK